MKIDLGNGITLEPDEGPRNTGFHRRILNVRKIPNTRTGYMLALDCGHQVMTFGNLGHAAGLILCTQCRDQSAVHG